MSRNKTHKGAADNSDDDDNDENDGTNFSRVCSKCVSVCMCVCVCEKSYINSVLFFIHTGPLGAWNGRHTVRAPHVMLNGPTNKHMIKQNELCARLNKDIFGDCEPICGVGKSFGVSQKIMSTLFIIFRQN